MNDFDSLSEKLRSLGVRLGCSDVSNHPTQSKFPIERVFPSGFEDQTPFGSTFIVECIYPHPYWHGNTLLSNQINTDLIQRWAKLQPEKHLDFKKFLFLDTETSGLAGGTGTYPFMVGLGFYNDEGFKLTQLFMRSPQDEQSLLVSLNRLVSSFEVIVTFNGKSFDVSILNSRHVLNGFSSPFTEIDQIDLLHLSRRIWRNRLEDRSLSSLEGEILEIMRGQVEIPGWLVPQIYFDYLRDGDARPLEGVFYHNAMDIVSLAALFNLINGMLLNPISENVKHAVDMVSLAQLFDSLELYDRAVQSYEAGLSQGLPLDFYISTLSRYAEMCRKNGDWEQAVILWKKAAELNQPEACIELSKYFEHKKREYEQAQFWAEQGLLLVNDSVYYSFRKQIIKSDLTHRLARIKKLLISGR